jgi:hypothetical protein
LKRERLLKTLKRERLLKTVKRERLLKTLKRERLLKTLKRERLLKTLKRERLLKTLNRDRRRPYNIPCFIVLSRRLETLEARSADSRSWDFLTGTDISYFTKNLHDCTLYIQKNAQKSCL